MAIPVAIPATKRKRGNPNWGHPIVPLLALPTEFEMRVSQLQLTARMYTSSVVHFRSKTPFDSGRVYLTALISCARLDENDLKTTQANLSMALPA